MKKVSGWPGAVIFVTLITGFTMAMAANTMYRWIDADGNVVYSDMPPPANARNAESLDQRQPISDADSDNAGNAPSYAEKEAQFQERQKQRAQAEAEAAKEADTAALRKKNCEQAQTDLQTVTNPPGGRLRELNSEGVLVYMTEEQVAARKAQANDAVQEWCKG